MREDTKELARLIEIEHDRTYKILCKKIGKENIDELYRRMDEALEIAIHKQFENFAEVKKQNKE
jgi:hypothetical protein